MMISQTLFAHPWRVFSFLEWVLVIWSVIGVGWWVFALWLVGEERQKVEGRRSKAGDESKEITLTIFKPLPPLRASPFALRTGQELASALESFISQLDESSDLLLGVEEQDRTAWEVIFEEWRKKYPQARFQAVFRPHPTSVPNPKIAWQMELAPLARGELWLWSDADIAIPPGFLSGLVEELQVSGLKTLTCPYVIRAISFSPGTLDALFVNCEFHPGTRLLKKRGTVHFTFGAGAIFHADDFRQKVDWKKLGSALADDYELGRLLSPVGISSLKVETLPDQESWRGAIRHYLRWHKTIRWCQPAGYAGQIAILPVLGWFFFALSHPFLWTGWLGWVLVSQLEVFLALGIFRKVGCPLSWPSIWVVEGWTLFRPLAWLITWLPFSVQWGREKWRKAK